VNATARLELRLRYRTAAAAGVGLVIVIMIVGALYPSLKDTFGKLNVPRGVANLLGGADYSTLPGWLQSEIVATYGPLVFCAVAITTAAAAPASSPPCSPTPSRERGCCSQRPSRSRCCCSRCRSPPGSA
jgi:hypothetical protein